jgi:Tol biopolymer transport system component
VSAVFLRAWTDFRSRWPRVTLRGWLVSWSPDSTRVATWVTLGRTIAIDGIDGVRQAEIDLPDGKAPTGDYDPVWSPDGRSVLIRLGPPSPSRIWEIPVDGRAPREVPDEDVRSEYDASWSTDGRRIAYVPYLESYSLVVANADGSPIRVLDGARASAAYGPGDGPQYGGAVLSPDGDRAAFNVTSGPLYLTSGENAPRRYELGLVDVASGGVTTLYRPEGFDRVDPIEFSADGTRLLFRRSSETTASIWSVDVDGSNARQLIADAQDATNTKFWGYFRIGRAAKISPTGSLTFIGGKLGTRSWASPLSYRRRTPSADELTSKVNAPPTNGVPKSTETNTTGASPPSSWRRPLACSGYCGW